MTSERKARSDAEFEEYCINRNIDPKSLWGLSIKDGWNGRQPEIDDLINDNDYIWHIVGAANIPDLKGHRENAQSLIEANEELKGANKRLTENLYAIDCDSRALVEKIDRLEKAAQTILKMYDSSLRYSVHFDDAFEKLRNATKGAMIDAAPTFPFNESIPYGDSTEEEKNAVLWNRIRDYQERIMILERRARDAAKLREAIEPFLAAVTGDTNYVNELWRFRSALGQYDATTI